MFHDPDLERATLHDQRRELAGVALGVAATLVTMGAINAEIGLMLLVAVFVIPLALALPLIAVGLAVLLCAHGIGRTAQSGLRRRSRAELLLAPPLAVALMFCLGPCLFAAGTQLTATLRLFADLPVYERVVADARRGHRRSGPQHRIDPGPPLRVAFTKAAWGDNWRAVVFDPTEEVMQARGFDAQGRLHRPPAVTKLFGGDLVACRHLWRAWYRCSFT